MSTGSTDRGADPDDPSEPGKSGKSGDWDDVVLDQDFIRGAEVSEPAARTRMLTARWRRGAPEPQPWRTDEPPAGWFWSKRRRRRRRR
ncbi:SGM_3592 family protein [Streptomyces sp. NPDC000941]